MPSPYIALDAQTREGKDAWVAVGSPRMSESPKVDFSKIEKTWKTILKTQDGQDFDDYSFSEDNKIARYIVPVLPAPATILFLGTGSGREVYGATKYGYSASGTTLGKGNPPFAKEVFGIDLDYVDNCTLPYTSKVFDLVAGFQIFEHCHSPLLFLFECARVIKEHGWLVLEWPPGLVPTSELSLESGHDHMASDSDGIHHVCCWTPFQAYSMVRRSGFYDVRLYLGGYVRELDRNTPEFYSNIANTDVVLRARRRSDGELPTYVRDSIY